MVVSHPRIVWVAISIGQGIKASFLIPSIPLVKRTAIDVQFQKRPFYTPRRFFHQPDDLYLF
jgi:hypothetical protein